ncbi:eCIS core domain-containing protein [Hymenobacter cheonanensis]|uniref:eCIS core domain-containing protein n=1 Tax=Hymenobacter sp. CA2-7 TaxID=3063993 RepID=UPI002713A589|nr:DUF4157 domain-containing protein [Hymenobacter sp. CA2-7]MDO7883977.1 DUF4157 domain-containing protein [Hymenobacter sp. CA2-7]
MKDFAPRTPATKATEPATGKAATLVDNRASTVAQRKLQDAIAASPRQVAQRQPAPVQLATPRPNRTGLPDKLKAGVESLSGHSLDDVKVHYNSAKPAQLQAHAYAQGPDIHLGPGQEKHLPHEAWHVVQQKQGRVRPTRQLKKTSINDSTSLESEATAMGAKASRIRIQNSNLHGLQRHVAKYIAVQRVMLAELPLFEKFLLVSSKNVKIGFFNFVNKSSLPKELNNDFQIRMAFENLFKNKSIDEANDETLGKLINSFYKRATSVSSVATQSKHENSDEDEDESSVVRKRTAILPSTSSAIPSPLLPKSGLKSAAAASPSIANHRASSFSLITNAEAKYEDFERGNEPKNHSASAAASNHPASLYARPSYSSHAQQNPQKGTSENKADKAIRQYTTQDYKILNPLMREIYTLKTQLKAESREKAKKSSLSHVEAVLMSLYKKMDTRQLVIGFISKVINKRYQVSQAKLDDKILACIYDYVENFSVNADAAFESRSSNEEINVLYRWESLFEGSDEHYGKSSFTQSFLFSFSTKKDKPSFVGTPCRLIMIKGRDSIQEALNISKQTAHSNEKEVLFRQGTVFKVVSNKRINKRDYHTELSVIKNEQQQEHKE